MILCSLPRFRYLWQPKVSIYSYFCHYLSDNILTFFQNFTSLAAGGPFLVKMPKISPICGSLKMRHVCK